MKHTSWLAAWAGAVLVIVVGCGDQQVGDRRDGGKADAGSGDAGRDVAGDFETHADATDADQPGDAGPDQAETAVDSPADLTPDSLTADAVDAANEPVDAPDNVDADAGPPETGSMDQGPAETGSACTASSCCADNDCPGTCQTCSHHQCVPATGRDDPNGRCSGTCDGSGQCQSKQGQRCTSDTAAGCVSGTTCADGFCCDQACGSSCTACDVPGQEGTCSPVSSGGPHGNRTACAADGSECGGHCAGRADGQCDYPVGSCGNAMCLGTSELRGAGSCGDGFCVLPAAQTCAGGLACASAACNTACGGDGDCQFGYACSSGACLPSGSFCDQTHPCANGSYCNGSGVCAPKKQNGDGCQTATECAANFCVGGHCCGQANCGSGGPRVCSDDGWCWENPRPQGRSLNAVWGSGASDVWTVGEAGTILHWDGSAWSRSASGTTATLRAIWGSGPSDVWAAGDGIIRHWNGAAWSATQGGTATGSLKGLWGSGANDVWAVGDTKILHWNGTQWSPATRSDTASLDGVWGSGPNDVWATAHEGQGSNTSVHWDGQSWTPIPIGYFGNNVPIGPLSGTSVWGSGPNDVWMVGSGLVHWNGAAWSNVSGGGSLSLGGSAIWGSGSNDVWIVGGGARHWNGSTWAAVDTGTTRALRAAWGSGPNDVWAVGDLGTIQHWDGAAWSQSSTGPRDSFHGVWGSGPSDVWIVGASTQHWNGSALSQVDIGTTQFLYGVWGSGPNDVWLVGDGGTILHWDGSTFQPNASDHPDVSFSGVWGTGPNDAWTFGCARDPAASPFVDSCIPAVLRWNGSTWADSPGAIDRLTGVWGAAPNDVWGASTNINPVHWNGSSWQAAGMPPAEAGVPFCIWGSGPNDVYAATYLTLWHWNGSAWGFNFPQVQGGTFDARSIWGTGPSDIWTAGSFGRIAHWNGSKWLNSASGANVTLNGVWGSGANDVWAVGEFGTILHWTGQPAGGDGSDAGADSPVGGGDAGSADAEDSGVCLSAKAATIQFATPGQAVQIDNSAALFNVPDIALADFTGDAVPDLIIGAGYGTSPPFVAKVQLSRGRGDGTFDPPQVIWTGGNNFIMKFLVVDVDGDNHADIVLDERANSSVGRHLHVLRGDGAGHFTEPDPALSLAEVTNGWGILLAGDLTGDGLPELLMLSDRNILVHINANGTFPSEVTTPYTNVAPSIISSLALGYLDGDKNLDVVYTRVDDPNFGGTGAIGLLYGKGDGSFVTGPGTYGAIRPTQVLATDFDRDGLGDLQVIASGNSVTLTRYVQDSSTTITPTSAVTLPPAASNEYSVVDVDGDCTLDFVYPNADTIYVYRGHGDGTFDNALLVPAGHRSLTHGRLADLNGDGRPDIVYAGKDATSGSTAWQVIAALNQSTP